MLAGVFCDVIDTPGHSRVLQPRKWRNNEPCDLAGPYGLTLDFCHHLNPSISGTLLPLSNYTDVTSAGRWCSHFAVGFQSN